MKEGCNHFLCVTVFYYGTQIFTFVPITRVKKDVVIDVSKVFCKHREDIIYGIKEKAISIIGNFKYALSEKERLIVTISELNFIRK